MSFTPHSAFRIPHSALSLGISDMPTIDVAATAGRIIANIEKVVIGKRPQITLAVAAYFSEGHILLEDVPGVAKTMFARALRGASAVPSNAYSAPPTCSPRT